MNIRQYFFKLTQNKITGIKLDWVDIERVNKMPYDELQISNEYSAEKNFLILIAKLAKLDLRSKTPIKDYLNILDTLLINYYKELLSLEFKVSLETETSKIIFFLKGSSFRTYIMAAIRLKNYNLSEFNSAIDIIKVQLVQIIIDLKLKKKLNNKNLLSLLKYTIKGIHSELNLSQVAEYVIKFSVTYYISEYAKTTQTVPYFPELQKQIQTLADLTSIPLPVTFLNICPVNIEEPKQELYDREKIYNKKTEYFEVAIYKLINNTNEAIALKEYSNFSNKKEVKDSIMQEIQILNLTSQFAGPDNCFIKIIDCLFSNETVSIYMEYYPMSLKSFIIFCRDSNQYLSSYQLAELMKKLIKSFALLQEWKIVHRDIKPQNILIDNTLSPKIIDYSVSYIRPDEECSEYTCVSEKKVKGTKTYLSPELLDIYNGCRPAQDFYLNKADVFSLGLTFLELVTLENVTGFNCRENEGLVKTVVNDLNCCENIKVLLFDMLEFDYIKRKNFKELISYFDATETFTTVR